MKSILDPSFRYVSSDATDVRKTFARVRRRLEEDGALSRSAASAFNAHDERQPDGRRHSRASAPLTTG
jgi:hypothetical protein